MSSVPGRKQEIARTLREHFRTECPAVIVDHLADMTGEMLRDDGLLLYSSECIFERNDTFEVQRYREDFLAVGDDSGGTLFVIRFDDPTALPFAIDCAAVSPNSPESFFEPLALSWSDWVAREFPLRQDRD